MINFANAIAMSGLQTTFQIIRDIVTIQYGETVETVKYTIDTTGIIAPKNVTKQINMTPDADFISGGLEVKVTIPIYPTRAASWVNGEAQTDRIKWHGTLYRVENVGDFSDYGFYRADLVREYAA